MVIAWNTGAAAARFRHNLKLKKKKIKKRQATSVKLQAPSLTTEEYKILWDRYNVKKRS